MDFACSLRQPNVFLNCEGTRYKAWDRCNKQFRLQTRSINGNSIGNPALISRVHPTKKTRKMIAFSGFNLTGVFKQELLGKNLRRSLVYDYNTSSNCSRAECQNNDSLAFIDDNDRNIEFVESHDGSSKVGSNDSDQLNSLGKGEGEGGEEGAESLSLDELRETLQKAIKELEVARLNSTMFEEKAQKISEAAIALQDEAASAWNDVNSVLNTLQEIVNDEWIAKEAVQKGIMALSLAEARLQVAEESLEAAKRSVTPESPTESDSEDESRMEGSSSLRKEEEAFVIAQEDMRICKATLVSCEAELRRLQDRKEELQKEVDKLNEKAEKIQMDALKAEEEVANIMLLAEQAVAFELEATQHVNDAEIAIQKVEKNLSITQVETPETTQGPINEEALLEEEKASQGLSGEVSVEKERDMPTEVVSLLGYLSDGQPFEELKQYDGLTDQENGKLSFDSPKESETDTEKSKTGVQTKKKETQKDLTRDSSPLNAPKVLLKKSSRFFSASFFSFTVDGAELTPASVFHGLVEYVRRQFPKLVVAMLLVGAGYAFY